MPGPVDALKRLLMPSPERATAKRVAKETLTSPLADTLWQLSGGGRPMTTANPLNPLTLAQTLYGANAAYNPIFDAVTMSGRKLAGVGDAGEISYEAERFLAHEAGHRADMRRGRAAPGRQAPFQLPRTSATVTPKEMAARKQVDEYYQKSPREGYAQAFATAVQIMRQSPELLKQGMPREEYAKELADAEATFPGVGGIVQGLLKEPAFKNHPLQQFYAPRGQ